MLSDSLLKAYNAYVRADLALNQSDGTAKERNILSCRKDNALMNLLGLLSTEANIVAPREDDHDA